MNDVTRKYLLVLLFLMVVQASGCSQREIMAMERGGWNTHCFGRVVMELPPGAVLGTRYRIESDEFERVRETPTTLRDLIDSRVKELQALPHEGNGSMFVGFLEGPASGSTIISWRRADNSRLLWADSFFTTSDPWRTYRYSGLVSPELRGSAEQLLRDVGTNLYGLESGQIPHGAGFCVDGAWIAGTALRSEVMDISVKLPERPGMVFSLLSSTQAEIDNETLLDRGMLSEAILIAQGATRLRKGKRSPGGIPGGEYLMASTENGQRLYTFAWEAPGKAVSVTEPYLLAEMQVLGQPVVDDDNPYEPPFEDDEEALELWDAIIDSIRLLPGA